MSKAEEIQSLEEELEDINEIIDSLEFGKNTDYKEISRLLKKKERIEFRLSGLKGCILCFIILFFLC